jgi:allantoinase
MSAIGYEKRDLKGYGEHPPSANWPNNKKLAISFVLNYEEGGENTPYNNDTYSEVFLNETPGGTPRKERDLNMETIYEYGSRAGFWRVLRLFEQYKMRFTCYAVGKAVQENTCVVDAMQSRGHEVACMFLLSNG